MMMTREFNAYAPKKIVNDDDEIDSIRFDSALNSCFTSHKLFSIFLVRF